MLLLANLESGSVTKFNPKRAAVILKLWHFLLISSYM